MPLLANKVTVVAVDLRCVGGSAPTPCGYDAANLAEDIHRLAEQLHLEHVHIVGRDIGRTVTYAYIRRYRQNLRGAMILDVPIPGLDSWDEIQVNAFVWQIRFHQATGLTTHSPMLAPTVSARPSSSTVPFSRTSNATPAREALSMFPSYSALARKAYSPSTF
jgi:pimeloyl-ACP methyl ester carboxylesterase